MDVPILQLNHVRKIFYSRKTGDIPAVSDVNLSVFPGECVGIVGESGCGKSTLARLVTRLADCSSGEILLNGENITKLKGKDIRKIYRDIQMVFQDPYTVFNPRTNIATFLEDGLVYHGIMTREEAREEALRLLQMVELPVEIMDRFPHQLSGGQLQRVVIARAVSIHPKLVFLDEATSALDVSVQKQVLQLLVRLQKEYQLTYVFIGHDLAVVRSISHRIIIMYAGRIVEEINSENLDEVMHPYSKKLLRSVFSLEDRGVKELQLDTKSMADQGYVTFGCVYQRCCPYADDRCCEEIPKKVKISETHHVFCHHLDRNSDCWSI